MGNEASGTVITAGAELQELIGKRVAMTGRSPTDVVRMMPWSGLPPLFVEQAIEMGT